MIEFVMPTPLPFLRLCLLCLSLWAMATGVHANSGGEEKKKEAPEEVEKVPTYVKEPGVDARGQNYKRVARDNKGEPEPVPKEPLPPAPVKEDKKADAKGLKLVLMRSLGEAALTAAPPDATLLAVLEERLA